MDQISIFIKKYFRYIFYFLLAANLLVINKMNEHSRLLVNKYSPKGVISLELNFSQSIQDSILKTWDSTKKDFIILGTNCSEINQKLIATVVAHKRNDWDRLFIFLYSFLLLAFFLRLYPFKGFSPGLSVVVFCLTATVILDLIEDHFISLALRNHGMPVWYIWIPSLCKWIMLLIISSYLIFQMYMQGMLTHILQQFSIYLTGTVRLIWSFRIPFFGLLVLFLALWGMDQGRDLLLIINSSWLGPLTFLTTISIWALLNWYLPKLYIPAPAENISVFRFLSGKWMVERSMIKNQLDGARLMGCLSFLIPMIGILNAMKIFGIPYLLDWINPFFLLLITLGFYQMALNYKWLNHWFSPNEKVNKKRFYGLIILTLVCIFSLLLFHNRDKPYFLAYLSLDLFLLSFIFLVYTAIRSCDWGRADWGRLNMTPYVILPGMVLMSIFLLANIYPDLFFFSKSRRLLTLPVIICALCFYNILFSFILLKGKRLQIQFITMLFLLGLIISTLFDNGFHKVRMIPARNNFGTTDSVQDYIKSWLTKRKSEIDSFYSATGDSFPVFIINAYGGGIRAAAWTTMVMGELDKQMTDDSARAFQHYVLAYSGASGGTIGLSALCAARYSLSKNLEPAQWQQLFGNDFLTPLIIGLFGRDIWSSSFDLPFSGDRSVLQDKVWEERLREKGIVYDSPFVKYWDSGGQHGKYEVPLLFANTYDADSGLKAIVAPVRLSHLQFPGTIFVQDLLEDDKEHGIKLSTGAFLSARFPFISPTGKIDKSHHFMDGGLKENSGAETSREILEVLYKTLHQLTKSDSVYGKVKIILLSLPNTVKGTDSLQTVSNFYELTAPFTALENNWVGNTNKADTINARNTEGYFHYHYFQLRPSALCIDSFKPVLPLGWQISDYALIQMRKSLETTNPSLPSIVGIIRKKK